MKHRIWQVCVRLWKRPKPHTFELTTTTGGLVWTNPADSRVDCVITSLRLGGMEFLARPLPSIAPGGSFSLNLGQSIRQTDLVLTWIEG